MDTERSLPPDLQPQTYRFSRFQLHHVSHATTAGSVGDVCKETCKLPLPNTCKLECHSGAPFMDMQEEIPPAVCEEDISTLVPRENVERGRNAHHVSQDMFDR